MFSSWAKYSLAAILLLFFKTAYSQAFLNGSFEINTAGTDQANLQNWQYNDIMAHSTAFGSWNGGGPNGGNMDIIGSWDYCADGAQCGTWYVAFTSGGTDAISLTLSSPLVPGNSYTISFYDRSCSPLPAGSPVEIGVSNIADEFGTLVHAASAPVYNAGWTHRSLTFIAPFNALYVTARCGGANSGGPWTHIDNFTISSGCAGSVSLGNDTALCQSQSLLLDATHPCATYLWQDGSTNTTFTVTQQGTYWVEVTAGACIFKDTILVSYVSSKSVNLGSDKALCAGETFLLNASIPGATYLWQDGSTNPTFLVTQAGTYSVTASVGACGASDTINVTYNSSPEVNLGNDTVLCQGDSLWLNATYPGATYQWQDGSTSAQLLVTQSGSYSVTVTAGGCNSENNINVNYTSAPVAHLGNDTVLCQGETLMLNAAVPGASYVWQDGSVNSTFHVTQAGDYSVTASIGGCSSSGNLNVAYVSTPGVQFGNDTVLCQGETILLDVTYPGADYQWHNGSASATFTVTQPGAYHVTISADGCSSSDTIGVSYMAPPIINLGSDTVLCQGEFLLLNVETSGGNYVWQDGSANASFTVTQSGAYHVQVAVSGCSNADTIEVSYLPSPIVNLGNDTTLCYGEILSLNTSDTSANYLWHDGTDNAEYIVTQPGVYWVEVMINGCSARDSIIVFYNPLQPFSLGSDTVLCPGETISLQVDAPGAVFLWSDGYTGSTLAVSQKGQYWVEAALDHCAETDSIYIDYIEPLSFSLGSDTALCEGNQLYLDAAVSGATYVWHDGSTASFFIALHEGLHHVEVVTQCETMSDTVELTLMNCDCDLFFPTAFTPNNDGMNDIFRARTECGIMDFEMKIFNRWGEMVFKTKNIYEGWNGNFRGKPCSAEVYVYIAWFTSESNSNRVMKTGNVTLIR